MIRKPPASGRIHENNGWLRSVFKVVTVAVSKGKVLHALCGQKSKRSNAQICLI